MKIIIEMEVYDYTEEQSEPAYSLVESLIGQYLDDQSNYQEAQSLRDFGFQNITIREVQ